MSAGWVILWRRRSDGQIQGDYTSLQVIRDAHEEAGKDTSIWEMKIVNAEHLWGAQEELNKLFLDLAVAHDEYIYLALDVCGVTLTEAAERKLDLSYPAVAKVVAGLRAPETEKQKRLLILEKRIHEQRRQLEFQIEALKDRNLALDAMHYVWCSGGCYGGTHQKNHTHPLLPITEELVQEAERNTRRLREWFNANEYRKAREKEEGRGEMQATLPLLTA